MDRSLSLLSLPVVAVALGALTLGLLFAGRYYSLGTATFALLAIPVVLALVYLAWYRTLPYEPPRPASMPTAKPAAPEAAPDDEEFEDPVEEADRLERTGPANDAAASPSPPGAPGSPPKES